MPTQAPRKLDARRAAFFLDFDGTLVPFDAPDVKKPRVDDGLRSLLAELHECTGGALALISGRTIETIDDLFEPMRLAVAGEHGAEWRLTPDGEHSHIEMPSGLNAALAACEAWVKQNPGTRFERKKLSMVLHFHRHPELRDSAAAVAQAVCLPGRGIKMLHARGMVEIKPSAASKGHAVERFMRNSPYAGRKPVFLGDDVTDEDGFFAANALGGISVKIGPGTSHAHYRLPDHDAVREWLESCLD
ncbi:MAG: trehalose-phosphatase [Betaproteobacteria bacterium]|nr:trehalose-phosphatase [Betaproteobacteria bacterium]